LVVAYINGKSYICPVSILFAGKVWFIEKRGEIRLGDPLATAG